MSKKNRLIPKVVDNSKLIIAKQKALAHAEARDQKQKKDLLRARQLYEIWKDQFMAEGCPVDKVHSRFDAFRQALKKQIKNRPVVQAIFAELHFAEIKFLAVHGPRRQQKLSAPPPTETN